MSITVTDGIGDVHIAPLPVLNAKLLEEVIAWAVWNEEIRSNIEPISSLDQYLQNIPTWGQGGWTSAAASSLQENHVCKTSFCIAGYGLYVSGHVGRRILTDPEEIAQEWGYSSAEDADLAGAEIPEKIIVDRVINLHKLVPNAEDYDPDDGAWSAGGQAIFGLTDGEADRLFDGDNSLDRIQELAQDIAESRGLLPLRFDNWTFTVTPKDELWAYFDEDKLQEVPA